jgi:hypothetical protein
VVENCYLTEPKHWCLQVNILEAKIMRSSKNDYDIDFIGGGTPITKAEELEIRKKISGKVMRTRALAKKLKSA